MTNSIRSGSSEALQSAQIQTPGGAGGELNQVKDRKNSATEEQFGEVWNKIQNQYGAKAEKPKERKKALDKDDFLKIMMTQMKYQDPTKAANSDPQAFAQQLAQFSSLEQLQNLNTGMKDMIKSNQPIERMTMTNLIGKSIFVDRERFEHIDNQSDVLGFGLPKDAAQVNIRVIDAAGEEVFKKDLGSMKAGEQTYTWDGLKENQLAAKAGQYIYKVEAKDANGVSIALNTKGQAQVVGVSFEGKEGSLLVGDAKNPQRIPMRNVTRIELGNTMELGQTAKVSSPSNPMNQKPASESEIPVDPALSEFVAHQAEKGFPNGLQSE